MGVRDKDRGAILFHLAFPVTDFTETKHFYLTGLGGRLGRESAHALVLQLGGHQLVAHLSDTPSLQQGIYPRHFGLIFKTRRAWQAMADRVCVRHISFYQAPRVRFPGTRLEHATFFLEDPSGNLLEFKHYKYRSAIFGERLATEIGDTASTVSK